MTRILLAIVANGAGLYAASRLVNGFVFTPLEAVSLTGLTGTYVQLAVAAVTLSIINALIRPVIKLVSGPVTLITFGLFGIVINMGMLWLLDLLIPSLIIESLTALVWGTLLIGFVNLIFSPFKK